MTDRTNENQGEPRKHWRRVRRFGQWLCGVVCGALMLTGLQRLGVIESGPQVTIHVEQPALVHVAGGAAPSVEDLPIAQGWVPDVVAMMEDAKASGFRTFADTPAGQAGDLPTQVFLWQIHQRLLGEPTPLKDQNPTGSCVGFGSTTAIERTEASEITQRGGNRTEFTFYSEEVTYAGGKVLGAKSMGARVDSRDGSAGVFTKAFLAAYGMCPKGKYSVDLTTYDPARARSWNVSGPPADVLEACKRYPVKDGVRITSWEQAKAALGNGYGGSICAAWKFQAVRDANGVAAEIRDADPWNHCMCLDGYIVLPDGRQFGHIENSWSNLPDRNGKRTGQPYHSGPVGWGSPTTAGFWASSDAIERALRQGDSYAYSGITGFPARRIPRHWFIHTPAPADRLTIRGVPCLAL